MAPRPPTDTTAPSAPTGLTAGTTTTTSVPLSWTASTDNVAVTGYDVYRGTTLVGTTTSTSYTVTGLTAAHRVLVHGQGQGRRRQRVGRIQLPSRPPRRPARVTDTTAPSVPTGLTAGTTTTTSVPLSWTASTDNAGGSGVAGYEVYRGSTLVGTTTSTSYTVTGLTAAHRVLVHGQGQGRWRATSPPRPRAVSATTQTGTITDTTAPSAPTGLTAGTTTTTSVPLSWTASTDNVAVTGYDVYRGTTLVGTTTSTSYTVTGLTAAHRVLVHGQGQGRRRQRVVRVQRRLGHHAVRYLDGCVLGQVHREQLEHRLHRPR